MQSSHLIFSHKPRRDLTFRVFVSSTFNDLKAERNVLQVVAFPRLREYCRQRGAHFQAIDLRWGVSQEASLDQQTMRICMAEVARCQELSPQPNFIVLLGQRYGWQPLPETLAADLFEEIERELTAKNSEVAKILKTWYWRDDNAVPPEYVLQPRKCRFEDFAVWQTEIELPLLSAMVEASDAVLSSSAISGALRDDHCSSIIGLSATHQEIIQGALRVDAAEQHVFAYFREINDAPSDVLDTAIFIDRDTASLDALKRELGVKLPASNRFAYLSAWQDVIRRYREDTVEVNIERESDLKQLADRVFEDLKRVIDNELDVFIKRPSLELEREAHREFGRERSRHFIGRRDALSLIAKYLSDDTRTPLVICGASGSGKTALMAKVVVEREPIDKTATVRNSSSISFDIDSLYKADPVKEEPQVAIISRFIGVTPESAELRLLLQSLCEELGIGEIPQDVEELVCVFRQRLSGVSETGGKDKPSVQAEPVIVFLDALDQLNDNDNARILSWLPRKLAPGVKMVLSFLEPDTPEALSNDYSLPTLYSACLNEPGEYAKHIWPDTILTVSSLSRDEGADILDSWLKEAGRTLQPVQRNEVLDKFAFNGRPLFLKLSFEEARNWNSWITVSADVALSDTVEGLLSKMLQRLEQPRYHGRFMVEHALGNIAVAKNGLTEEELLDVLSAETSVMEWLHSQSPTEQAKPPEYRIHRLPIVIWSRLHASLKPYMRERRADGVNVMNFYHNQVGEAVARRYLADVERRFAAHQRLAEFFHGLDYWTESLEAKHAPAMRLSPALRPAANVRKVVELPYHRLEAAKLKGKGDPNSPYWDALVDLLTNWRFLEAKVEADPYFGTKADHRQAEESGRISEEILK